MTGLAGLLLMSTTGARSTVVDAGCRQRLGHGSGLRIGKGRDRFAVAQLLCRHGRRETVFLVQARYQPAFLVGGDQQGQLHGRGLGIVREALPRSAVNWASCSGDSTLRMGFFKPTS